MVATANSAIQRERERQREIDRERQTERQRDRQTDRQSKMCQICKIYDFN